MYELILIIIACIIVSLIGFVGIFFLGLKEELLQKIIFLLVGLAAGALLGGGLLDLLPEALEMSSNSNPLIDILLEQIGASVHIEYFPIIIENIQNITGVKIIPHLDNNTSILIYVVISFLLFFLIEKLLFWRHCHKIYCEIHTFAYMNMVGDTIHNFVDGLIIATTFIASIPLGVITFFAIVSHEIPQEIGDFAVLVHGGYSRRKALFMNFIVQLACVLGGILGYFIITLINAIIIFLLPFAVGGFLYISATDLTPELMKEESLKKSIGVFLAFILGIFLIWLMKYISQA